MRSLIFISIAFIVTFHAASLNASYLDKFYSKNTLKHYQSIYSENIRWNFENLLLKNLTPKERRAIGKVNLTFPLIVPKQNAPINFYATNQPRGILMPILSVKLFDDVAIASAWLMFNGYSQNTVYDYMSIIKYNNPKSFPGHRYPLPLKALQIPANALKDSRVDSLSQQILKSAIVFILAHELGHLRYNHPGYDIPLDQARKNELEADDFALELMRRIGVPPFGMTHFFLTAFYMSVHRGDFSSDKEWEIYLREKSTHPLSPGRIRGLTSKLRKHRRAFARTQPDLNKGIKQINYIALQLDGIADILGDKKIQKRVATVGKTMGLEFLGPRPAGDDTPQLQSKQSKNDKTGLAYSGLYKGKLNSGEGSGLNASVRFERNGKNVIGSYTYASVAGTLKGIVKNNLLYFQWREGNSYGKGVFKATKNGDRFDGTWGYAQSNNNGGKWSGVRK